MPHAVEIGRLVEGGGALRLDVPALIATRLLVQAMAGGGKSWTLRLLLEQTHGQVQHIVLDPEGEFASLREHFDYVLIGKGGDRAAKPQEAGALARSVLELQCNVICDLYELPVGERKRFVRLFLESLVNAPKALWHPALVVIDEAHSFCPQKREAESAEAVIDLLARGRKRGFAAVLATQRIAKLDKDAAAECGNVMVGRTVQDVDRARALDMLAVSRDRAREIDRGLMTLPAGTFYSIGMAFEPQALSFFRVGAVQTKHPQIGRGQLAAPAPPPSARIKAVLDKLDHISRDQEEEANERVRLVQTIGELRGEVRRLEAADRARPTADPEQIERQRAEIRQTSTALAGADLIIRSLRTDLAVIAKSAKRGLDAIEGSPEAVRIPPAREKSLFFGSSRERSQNNPAAENPRRGFSPPKVAPKVDSDGPHLRAGARRMLETLARHHPMVMTRSQLATLSRFAPRGGTYGTYLGDLKRAGYIELGGREVSITAEGLAGCDHIAPRPMRPDEILETWRGALRAGARRMLDELVAIHPEGMIR